MRKRGVSFSYLIVPLLALLLIVIFNLIRDPSFFTVKLLLNNNGDYVLSGNLISILNGASELAVLAMGMTLVTAASGGQDISVGAAAAIAGSVFVKILRGGDVDLPLILAAFLACCVVTMIFGAFNGVLVSVFKIQPMIATLILFTSGRSIAYWINGGATPTVSGEWLGYLGGFIPGISVPTPIFIVILCGALFWLLLKFTNLRLYTQALGINEKSARLNGIDTIRIKILSFIILAVCVAVAGAIRVCRLGLINHETILLDIEMDAILAVAIGGNVLSGGKFSMVGSVIGAYIIQALTTTLYAMKVPSNAIKAYKAIVIIALVVIGSPIVKKYVVALRDKLFKGNAKKVEGV
jgi:simple sugar transport system permease protein